MSRRIRALVVAALAALSIAVLAAPASAAPKTIDPLFKLCTAQGGEPQFFPPTAIFTCDKPSGFSAGELTAAQAMVTKAYALYRPVFGSDSQTWLLVFGGIE